MNAVLVGLKEFVCGLAEQLGFEDRVMNAMQGLCVT